MIVRGRVVLTFYVFAALRDYETRLIRTFSEGDVADLDGEAGRAQVRCAALVTDAKDNRLFLFCLLVAFAVRTD